MLLGLYSYELHNRSNQFHPFPTRYRYWHVSRYVSRCQVCFTICLCISPDLDGYRAPKMKYWPRKTPNGCTGITGRDHMARARCFRPRCLDDQPTNQPTTGLETQIRRYRTTGAFQHFVFTGCFGCIHDYVSRTTKPHLERKFHDMFHDMFVH